MDLILVIGGVLILGIVLGWLGATHVHSVASAASRATTLPSGDIAALNAKVDGLGTKLQAIIDSAAKPAIAAAVNSIPPSA